MKSARRLLTALTVFAVLFSGVSALAQFNPPIGTRTTGTQPARPTQRDLQWQSSRHSFNFNSVQDIRARADVADEAQAQKQINALAPAKFDHDGNGRFDEKELNAWLSAVRQAITQSPSAMSRFDTSHDGKLDDTEWQVVLQQLIGKS